MGTATLLVNLGSLQEGIQNVQTLLNSVEDISSDSFSLPLSQGDTATFVKGFFEDSTAITDLSKELFSSYINVMQAAHDEYVGSDSDLAAQFNQVE